MIRAKLESVRPSSSLYSGVSRFWYDELSGLPVTPRDTTPASTCVPVSITCGFSRRVGNGSRSSAAKDANGASVPLASRMDLPQTNNQSVRPSVRRGGGAKVRESLGRNDAWT